MAWGKADEYLSQETKDVPKKEKLEFSYDGSLHAELEGKVLSYFTGYVLPELSKLGVEVEAIGYEVKVEKTQIYSRGKHILVDVFTFVGLPSGVRYRFIPAVGSLEVSFKGSLVRDKDDIYKRVLPVDESFSPLIKRFLGNRFTGVTLFSDNTLVLYGISGSVNAPVLTYNYETGISSEV